MVHRWLRESFELYSPMNRLGEMLGYCLIDLVDTESESSQIFKGLNLMSRNCSNYKPSTPCPPCSGMGGMSNFGRNEPVRIFFHKISFKNAFQF